MNHSPLAEAHIRVVEQRIADLATLSGSRDREGRLGAATGKAEGDGRSIELDLVPWGVSEESSDPSCMLVADYGELESEYAAIRRGTAMMDRADRGLVELRGPDASDLISRLVTNVLPDGDETTQAYVLARTGRVLSDLRMIVRGESVLLDLDRTDAELVVEHLGSFVFAEEVEIIDHTPERHRIELYGPDVEVAFKAACPEPPPELRWWLMEQDGTSPVGEMALAIDAPIALIESIWDKIISTTPEARRPPRAIGWHAFNIARIEAGSAIFHVDFGPDALPHETGMIPRRVSFKKGCYPGQEVVARMESRGKSKRKLVGLRVQGHELPIAGGQVFKPDAEDPELIGKQVGVITSSTLAPMLGAVPIAFASIGRAGFDEGTTLRVVADGRTTEVTVGPLDFLAAEKSGGEDS